MVTDPTAGSVTTGLAVVAVAAAAFAILMRRLGQPTVVGFLAAGILLGPVLGLVTIGSALEALGELGVALLLFLVGLDLSLDEVRAVGPPAFIAGTVQLVGSTLGGYYLALFLGFGTGAALFLAVALAFSSTVVVVKILVDLGDMATTYGRLAVGVFLVQDLFIVLLLTLLPLLGGGGLGAESPSVFAVEIGLAFARTLVIIAAALVAARLVLPLVFRPAAGHPGLLLLLTLAWLFVLVVASEGMHVSVEVGAFAGGLGLSMMPYAHDLRRRVHPLLDLFLALFFVTLGVRFALGDALAILPAALLFTVFVLIGNALVLTLVLAFMGYSREASFRTGIAVGQVSEFSIVLAALAITQDLITPEVRDFVVLVMILTVAASSVLIWRSKAVYDALSRFKWFRLIPDGDRDVEEVAPPPDGHVLLVGWDAFGAALARALHAAGERVVVVAAHPDVPDRLPPGVDGVYADPENTPALEAAGLRHARFVIANLPEPGLVRVLLDETRGGPPVIARAEAEDVAELLEKEGASAVLAPPVLVAGEVLRRLPGGDAADG